MKAIELINYYPMSACVYIYNCVCVCLVLLRLK